MRPHITIGTSIWPSICKLKNTFWKQVGYKVHSRARVLFWDHNYLGTTTLKARSPRIYRLCQNQRGTIAEFGRTVKGELRGTCNSEEIFMILKFQKFIKLVTELNQTNLEIREDMPRWIHDNKGVFLKSCYRRLSQDINTIPSTSLVSGLPYKLIWDSQIPARVNMFLWEINRKAIQTKARLNKIFPDKDPICTLLCYRIRVSQSYFTHLCLYNGDLGGTGKRL